MKQILNGKMNIVIVGHVDHGKSTLIGRLLADTNSLPKGKLEQIREHCSQNSKPFEYAFLLDALKHEQAQGITIDTARCFFKSNNRDYIIIDAPGHIEFLKNMISGAARAEAAIVVIDAKEGIRENSKRHGYLLSMLGIRQLVVCINKMDLVGYQETVFRKLVHQYSKFLKQIGLEPHAYIPICAMGGDNLISKSGNMPWHRGDTVLSSLDALEKYKNLEDKPFRLPVQGIYKFTEDGDDRRIIAGRIESGKISAGDNVIFFPSKKRSRIKTIEHFDEAPLLSASTGCSTGITLTEQIYINRGEMMCRLDEPHPLVSPLFKARIFWMSHEPMKLNKDYKLKICTIRVPVRLKKIVHIIDATNLKKSDKKIIERHDVAECIFECDSAIPFDLPETIETTGRFVLVDQYDIAGGGIIAELVRDDQATVREQTVIRETKWDFSIVDPKDRESAYGHAPKLLLLTGRAVVDKKSIAKMLEKKLFQMGAKTYFLGIGNLLRGLDTDLERDRASRKEHVRRLGEVSHILMDAGLIVLATASGLNDEELLMLQELTSRDSMLIINVGKNDFRSGIVDLNLDARNSAHVNVQKILKFIDDGCDDFRF